MLQKYNEFLQNIQTIMETITSRSADNQNNQTLNHVAVAEGKYFFNIPKIPKIFVVLVIF